MIVFTFSLILLVSAPVFPAELPMTPTQYRFLQRAFQDRIDFFDIPKVVRLAFHDCVGGCDGCVDLDNPSNRGLETVWDWAVDFRAQFAQMLSMADVVAFLGTEALKTGADLINNTVEVDYWVGRKDCNSSKGLPKRTFIGHDAMDGIEKLGNEFSLTTREAVALMGCHSLGGMHRRNSGFTLDPTSSDRSAWDLTPIGLDAEFFREIVNENWVPRSISNEFVNASFWTNTKGEENLMMLNADMAMFKNYTLTGDFDTPSCDVINRTSCPMASSHNHVLEFAGDELAFLETLGVAFAKMINGNGVGMYSVANSPDLIF